MPKLRVISGKELMRILLAEGFVEIRQKGSHARLVLNSGDSPCHITIPLHDEISRGTLKSITRSLQRCFNEDKLKELFHTR